MGVNPCCMPLKVGVKIITHMSMALAIAVGVMGIRLIMISVEVTAHLKFQQQHHISPHFGDEILWKSESEMMMKDSLSELMHPQEDESPDGLFTFSQSQIHLTNYSKVMLMAGLMASSAAIFQFLCSCLLLCFINWEGKSPSQIWVAVSCSILFCLATCLVLFLCGNIHLTLYSFDEKLFLWLVGADLLSSCYFLWIVMAFI